MTRVEQPRLKTTVFAVSAAWEPGRRFAWTGSHPGAAAFADHVLEPTPTGCRPTLTLR
ncbi:hypothetical protein [Paludisphaera mucosa]|uniref:Uncharacterized protein n=1 Tax=Paludisphaera mucosa TaxID=3030827 RepID=A0ABT6FC57_9BACT|nr:hypothetical protein [Paludisphaera mucosa]MDG3005117.1 hypothetical protein [Paludisphaera mucosa]